MSLCNHCCLNVPLLSDQFTLHTDASGRGIGAGLNICRDGEEKPGAFFSRQLQGPEIHYSATKLEALAVVKAVTRFMPYLYGKYFQIITDHKAFTSFMSSTVLKRRLQGMALKLMGLDFDIIYHPGADNSNADGLSRRS